MELLSKLPKILALRGGGIPPLPMYGVNALLPAAGKAGLRGPWPPISERPTVYHRQGPGDTWARGGRGLAMGITPSTHFEN